MADDKGQPENSGKGKVGKGVWNLIVICFLIFLLTKCVINLSKKDGNNSATQKTNTSNDDSKVVTDPTQLTLFQSIITGAGLRCETVTYAKIVSPYDVRVTCGRLMGDTSKNHYQIAATDTGSDNWIVIRRDSLFYSTERLYDKFQAPNSSGKALAQELSNHMQTQGYYPCVTPSQLRRDLDGKGYQLWCTYGDGGFQGRYFILTNPEGSYGKVAIEDFSAIGD